MRDGVIQQVGRYPNASAPNSGYLTYTASTATSITGPALSSQTNWTGAEVAVRLFRWEIRRRIVTSHSGGTVTFATMVDVPRVNYGYFFQRDPRTLDQDGEWWQDGTNNRLRMYFANNNPNAYTIQAASVDTLFLNSKSSINVTDLSFVGSNKAGIMNFGCSRVLIKNCDAISHGEDAITAWFCTNLTVDSCTTLNSLGSGLRIRGASTGVVNLAVRNCVVTNTGLKAGMETSNVSSSGNGILCSGGDNVQVINNIVTNSGYNGIEWKGNNVYIKNNLVDNFGIVRDDGGGVYTWEAPAGAVLPVRTNRKISGNIVLDGIGANDGTSGTTQSSVAGVYVDEGTRDVTIDSNTLANINGSGVHGNSNGNITIRNNTTFNTINSTSFQQLSDENPIGGIIIKNNIFYPYRFRYRNLAINLPTLLTKEEDIYRMGSVDSNYYCLRPGPDTSLTAVTTWKDGSHYLESFEPFPYLVSPCRIELSSKNVVNTGKLEYNATSRPVTRALDARYISPDSLVYNGSINLLPFTSAVLINAGDIESNQAPTASVTSNKLINLPINTTSLSGTGDDPDGTVRSYSWTQISGPFGPTIGTPFSTTTSISNLVQGIYQFQFIVTDNEGATASGTVQVTVNGQPTANAGADKVIHLPVTSTNLTGSGVDSDGTVSSYAWVKISGPSSGTISSPNSANTNLTNLAAGVYQFQLTVTDNLGATGKDTVQVRVNRVPVVNAGTDQVIHLPLTSTNLTGTASDPDGTVSSYAWAKLTGPAGDLIGSANAAATSVDNLGQGIYQYILTVTDNNGGTAKDTVAVRVNKPPTVNAGANQVINGSTANLSGGGTDDDGTVSSYIWQKLSGPSGGTIVTPNAANTNLSGLVPGVYIFELAATDNYGGTGRASVQVTVNGAPTADAGANQVINGSTASLAGSGTDNDGSISSYSWTKLSGPVGGTLVTPNAATTNLSALVRGIYIFELTVTDNNGATATATVQVTVNGAPTADAGPNQVINGSTANLSGGGTDDDGSISGYSWAKLSGPPGATIVTPNAANTSLSGLVKGVYVFELTVTDNNGATAMATVQVTVNSAPVANAGTNQVINGSTATLAGSGTDDDGSISSYRWAKLSGPSGGTILTPNAATTNLSGLVNGVYVFELTVSDNNGATGTASVQVTVNSAPVANAGTNQLINGSTATLSGSGTDDDGSISSYRWAKLSGPSGGTIVTPNAANTNLSGLIYGVYVFELTVTDNDGATAAATVQVAVNSAPVANAGTNQLINGSTATLFGSGADDDGSISSYGWAKLSGPSGGTILTPNAATTNLSGLVYGIYIFELTVTDNNGSTATATVQVTVNSAPVANAGTNQLINGSTATLFGSGTDDDGSISSYRWAKLSGPLGGTIVTPNAATTNLGGLVNGLYVFELTVTDNNGATATATVQVTVNAAPVANAGTNQLINLPASTATLTGSGNDIDGTIVNYAWSKLSGPANGTISSPGAASTALTGLVQGTYVFQLIVTDNNGATGTATVQVVVNAAPVADAGTNKLVNLPANSSSLTGTGTDADGTIVSYAWAKFSGPANGTIASPTSATTALTGLVQGTYVFQLTVIDNNGANGTATVQVIVNAAPVANAGINQLVNLPASTATLTGSGNDADGTIVSYAWSKFSGPANGTISSPTAATTALTSLVQGTYVFQLTVTDNNGATGSATVQVVVNAAPVANAGTNKLVNLPASTTTLTGSGNDADGTIASYAWSKFSGPASGTISSPTAATTGLTGLVQGTYVFQLTVTDNNGATGAATVQVIVNAAPVADAGTNQLVNLPVSTSTLTGSGSDADGTIASYAWSKLSGPSGGAIGSPTAATTALTGLVQGTYVFQLTVTDNNGATGTATVQVVVNAAPVANAGTNKLVNLPASTTTLTGSGSDADGTIASYAWSKFSGPASGTIASPTAASTALTGLVQGTYVFQLIVTDNNGATGTATVQVVVNAAPVADAGTNKLVNLPANSSSLTGTGTDADGTIVSYAWAKFSGPANGTIASPTAATTALTGLVQGTYVFQLTVTDNNGATGTATVQVVVNAAPVANAGTNQLVNLPASTATLTGSGNDADGTIASYAWSKFSGPASGTIASPTAATTVLTSLVQGTYVFQLTVTDNNGATGTATVQVVVNTAPVANAGTNQLVNLPASTTTLTGSGNDADGTIASYAWSKFSGPSGGTISSPTVATTAITGLVQGTYVFQLTVTDNNGATGTAIVQVIVNAAPVANAGTNQLVNLPASTTTLTGSGSDADGTIASYSWSKFSGPASGTIATPTATTTALTGLVQGTYVFQLTVTDNNGAIGTSTVQVVVNAAPVANAGTNKLVNLPASTTTLTGSGSDADGTIASYAWSKFSGPSGGTISSPTAATTAITGLVQGTYVFQLTVTDNNGATGTATVQVIVNAAPVANAGTNQLVNLPASTSSLTGTGTDADGTIVSYAWSKFSGPASGTIATPTATTTALTGLVQGTYVFQLTVTDNNGATGSATVQVVVNAAPVANAGTNKLVNLPASTTTLIGSGSDADGTIASYAWSKFSGPASGTISSPIAATTGLTGLVQGTYVFQLTVTDNNGAAGTSTVQVVVNAAPAANAGTNQLINLPVSTATLTGSGNDADGTIASYAWSKFSGPASGTISNPTAATTALSGLVQGTYVFQLTVTDNNGATGTATVQVIVNAAPVANAGTNQLVNLPVSTSSLTGSATDADGTIAGYAWSKISGPASGTITSPTTATTALTGLVQGTYVFQLTVTDNNGATGTATVQVVVNAAPVANAGTNKLVNLPANTSTLTGSATDADGTIVSYAWSKSSGPASGTITSPTAATTGLTSLVQGTYVFLLTVTDNNGATGTSTLQVIVNAAPVANAGTNKVVNLPANTSSLTGTATDADGTIVSYAWSKSSGPASGTITSPTAATTTLTSLVQGTYVFQLTVTDNNGATGSSTVQVIENAAPVANAGADKIISLPTNTSSLTGTGTDGDGTISSYAWAKVSGPAAGTIASPSAATTNLSGLVQGTYLFTLTVTDNNGSTAKDTVQVRVNQPPVANAGTDKVILSPASTSSLSGSATDADGTVSSYAWSKVSGPTAGSISSPTSASTNLTGLTQGTYLYQLAVTDNNGAVGRDTVQVKVNRAPVANAGADKVITWPVNTSSLTGTGTDTDGTISSYAWSKVSGPTAGTISSPTAATTNLTGLTQGTYLYQLTVTDNNGATARDTVQVKVNRAPTANAGTNKTITLPTNSTTLSGTGTDLDGTISSYAWAKISGPTTGTITSPSSANTGLSSLVQGTYLFQLTVTDNNAAIGRDTVQVIVNGSGNQAPRANAGTDKVVNLPSTSTTLTGSGTDADGTIRSYAWTKISGPSSGTIATPNSATTSLNSLVQGTYLFQLTVTDNNFAIGRDTIQVKVNRTPTANAGTDKTITLPSNSTILTGSGTDVDGTISSYAWAKISGPSSGTITSPNAATTTLTNLAQGTYLYQLTVTDNNGATGRDTVQVRVNPGSTLVFIQKALPLKSGLPYAILLDPKKLKVPDSNKTGAMAPPGIVIFRPS